MANLLWLGLLWSLVLLGGRAGYVSFNPQTDFLVPAGRLSAAISRHMDKLPAGSMPFYEQVDRLVDGISVKAKNELHIESVVVEFSKLVTDLANRSLSELKSKKPSFLEGLRGEHHEFEKHLEEVLTISKQVIGGRFETIKYLFGSLTTYVEGKGESYHLFVNSFCVLLILLVCTGISWILSPTYQGVPLVIFLLSCSLYGFAWLTILSSLIVALHGFRQRSFFGASFGMFCISLGALWIPTLHSEMQQSFCNFNVLLFDVSALLPAFTCQKPYLLPCPAIIPLVKRRENEIQLQPQAALTLNTLPGPVIVYAETGPSNSGKSFRLTMAARALTAGMYDHCSLNFGIRDPMKGEASAGWTRGISMLALSLEDIHKATPFMPKPLHLAVATLPQKGTFLLLDTEGSDEAGVADAQSRVLQLITLGVSSGVTVGLPGNLSPNDIKTVGFFSHILTVLQKVLASSHDCTKNFQNAPGREYRVNKKTDTFRPQLFLMPKDTINLLASMNVLTHERYEIPANATLDMTSLWQEKLQKETENGQMKETINLIKEQFADMKMFINLPPIEEPRLVSMSKLARFCPAELPFFNSLTETGLPGCWKCGRLCGYGIVHGFSHYVLPSLLRQLEIKVIYGEIASGKSVLMLIRDMLNLDLFKFIENTKLADPDQKHNQLCTYAEQVTKTFLNSDEMKAFEKNLPVEVENCPRIDPNTKVSCSDDAFAKTIGTLYSRIYQQLCQIQPYFARDTFWKCFTEILNDLLQSKYRTLQKLNVERCVYQWTLGPLTESCSGPCPTFKGRTVTCTNIRGDDRPTSCCVHLPKPNDTVSCEQWKYTWYTSSWSTCDAFQCGTQTRVVNCRRCDGEIVSDNFCLVDEPKPAISERCNIVYNYEYSGCVCHCGQNRQCYETCKACGETVQLHLCQEKAHRHTPYCGDCPRRKSCFGKTNNSVLLLNGSSVAIDQIRPGNMVKTMDGKGAKVLYSSASAPYYDYKRDMLCLKIGSEPNVQPTELTLTASHLVYVGHSIESRDMRAAGDIRVNDRVLMWNEQTSNFSSEVVSDVRNCTDTPLVLITEGEGELVVSGVVCSSFTKNFPFVQQYAARLMQWYVYDDTNFNIAEMVGAPILRWLIGNASDPLDYSNLDTPLVHSYIYSYDQIHQKMKAVFQLLF